MCFEKIPMYPCQRDSYGNYLWMMLCFVTQFYDQEEWNQHEIYVTKTELIHKIMYVECLYCIVCEYGGELEREREEQIRQRLRELKCSKNFMKFWI